LTCVIEAFIRLTYKLNLDQPHLKAISGMQTMDKQTRRGFISRSGTLIATTATVGLTQSALSQDHSDHGSVGGGLRVSTGTEKTCATCRFWGGMRRLDKDKSEITAQSMGWCNNPDSPNYSKLTQADHQMKKPGIWEKWSVL
jgi:hypothetical protein